MGRLVWACLETFLLIIKLRCLKYSIYLKVDGNTLRGINFVILIWPPCSEELNSQRKEFAHPEVDLSFWKGFVPQGSNHEVSL